MGCNRARRHWLPLLLVLAAAVWNLPPVLGATERMEPLRQEAERLESQGRWAEAADLWDGILRSDRNLLEVKEHYQTCLRHVHLGQRLHDPTYREEVLGLDLNTAVKVYDEILARLQANYVERDRADLNALFQSGLEELRLDLGDEAFCREFLPGVRADILRDFQAHLSQTLAGKSPRSRREVDRQVRGAALAAEQVLGLRAPVVVLEFACGACNGLDEYTYYLTPGQLAETYASLKGEVVGVGIEDVAVEEGKLVLKALVPGSSATKAGLQVGDRILRLDKKPVDNLTADGALDRFRGEVGTTIDLEILSPGYREPRFCTLTREAVQVKSVVGTDMLDPRLGIGYFQLVDFQESTVQEMDDAITSLRMQGMKALILDLRGNPGGLFEVAIQIAERFLAEGIIVATQSPVHAQNKTYEANNLEALDYPLVVLIDGDTASAAEVVAGALKENRRATLVGQTTYGKGSIQCVVKLDTVPAGIRITLAKFFSPQGHPYNGCGVTPHIVVDRTSHGFDEAQRLMALQEARQLLMMQH